MDESGFSDITRQQPEALTDLAGTGRFSPAAERTGVARPTRRRKRLIDAIPLFQIRGFWA